LAARNLYTPGSNAPEEVLREIYRNAYLAGNISNTNPQVMIDNYMSAEKVKDEIPDSSIHINHSVTGEA
jgi:hypothetical protein